MTAGWHPQPAPQSRPREEAGRRWGNARVLLPEASCPFPGAVLSALAQPPVQAPVWAGVVPVARYSLAEALCELSCPVFLAEDPSLATTNLTPWLWLLKTAPALTDRLAAPPFEVPALLLVDGR